MWIKRKRGGVDKRFDLEIEKHLSACKEMNGTLFKRFSVPSLFFTVNVDWMNLLFNREEIAVTITPFWEPSWMWICRQAKWRPTMPSLSLFSSGPCRT